MDRHNAPHKASTGRCGGRQPQESGRGSRAVRWSHPAPSGRSSGRKAWRWPNRVGRCVRRRPRGARARLTIRMDADAQLNRFQPCLCQVSDHRLHPRPHWRRRRGIRRLRHLRNTGARYHSQLEPERAPGGPEAGDCHQHCRQEGPSQPNPASSRPAHSFHSGQRTVWIATRRHPSRPCTTCPADRRAVQCPSSRTLAVGCHGIGLEGDGGCHSEHDRAARGREASGTRSPSIRSVVERRRLEARQGPHPRKRVVQLFASHVGLSISGDSSGRSQSNAWSGPQPPRALSAVACQPANVTRSALKRPRWPRPGPGAPSQLRTHPRTCR